jgi:Skp family chaperone for outer membrane proteins
LRFLASRFIWIRYKVKTPLRHISRSIAVAAAMLILSPPVVFAQSSQPGWFVPNQASPGGGGGRPSDERGARRLIRLPDLGPPIPATPKADPAAEAAADAQANAPIPSLPSLIHENPPPAPVIGVIGVPDVLQASTAARGVDKVIQARRSALTAEAQREQDLWRRTQEALADPRARFSPDELRARELQLQNRIASDQLAFRNQEARIQAAAQVSLGQIERTLIAVIRQVAQSRGMNLVLHRAQVALNMNDFDITDEVTKQLNQVLPSVSVPPDAAFANVTAASLQAQQQQQQGQQEQ